MAFISPRIAHNLAKNGYYPTDDATMKGIINCFNKEDKPIRVLDPCVGEGVAANYLANSISISSTLFGVEFNEERAKIAETRCDTVLRSDLFDTVISPQSFGLLFLNPPYGDLTRENTGAIVNYQKDYKRLEKIFYRFCIPLLQYDGILVLIIPFTQLDEMLSNWIVSQFTDIKIFSACDKQFKQVIIMGKKVRQSDLLTEQKNEIKSLFKSICEGNFVPGDISTCKSECYTVPEPKEPVIKSFYKLSFTQDEFENGLDNLTGLWAERYAFTQSISQTRRQPLCKMSDWHLSLALAAGEISGVVTSKTGKTYIIKGDTYKMQVKKIVTHSDDDGGNVEVVTTLTDKFIPSIKAWDFTPYSSSFGSLLVISSQSSKHQEDAEEEVIVPKIDIADDINPNVSTNEVKVGRSVLSKSIIFLTKRDFNVNFEISKAFTRYQSADFGEIDDNDKKLNVLSLNQGQKRNRIFGCYKINDNLTLWIITQWHESEQEFVTTLSLPEDN